MAKFFHIGFIIFDDRPTFIKNIHGIGGFHESILHLPIGFFNLGLSCLKFTYVFVLPPLIFV